MVKSLTLKLSYNISSLHNHLGGASAVACCVEIASLVLDTVALQPRVMSPPACSSRCCISSSPHHTCKCHKDDVVDDEMQKLCDAFGESQGKAGGLQKGYGVARGVGGSRPVIGRGCLGCENMNSAAGGNALNGGGHVVKCGRVGINIDFQTPEEAPNGQASVYLLKGKSHVDFSGINIDLQTPKQAPNGQTSIYWLKERSHVDDDLFTCKSRTQNDTVDGEVQNDIVDGRVQDDLVAGGVQVDGLVGGVQDDALDALDSGVQDDVVAGGVQVDALDGGVQVGVLVGGVQVDGLDGGVQVDVLDGGVQADVLDGGAQHEVEDTGVAAEEVITINLGGPGEPPEELGGLTRTDYRRILSVCSPLPPFV